MESVWVLFWSMMFLYAGFLIGRVVPARADARWLRAYELWRQMKLDGTTLGPWADYARDKVFGFAALAGIVGISIGCGALLGNPWVPATLFSFVLATGLAWGASPWLPKRTSVCGCRRCKPCEESWSERLARWGFPSSEQMWKADFREDLRGRLSLYNGKT